MLVAIFLYFMSFDKARNIKTAVVLNNEALLKTISLRHKQLLSIILNKTYKKE